MQTFEGDRCYPDLQSIPGAVDGVVVITRPEVSERIVHDCVGAGVRRVWMHASRWARDRAFRWQRSRTTVNTASASSLVHVR